MCRRRCHVTRQVLYKYPGHVASLFYKILSGSAALWVGMDHQHHLNTLTLIAGHCPVAVQTRSVAHARTYTHTIPMPMPMPRSALPPATCDGSHAHAIATGALPSPCLPCPPRVCPALHVSALPSTLRRCSTS